MNADEAKTYLDTELGKVRAAELLMQSKVKTIFVNYRTEILIGLLVLVIIFAVFILWPANKPDTTIEILNAAKKQMEEQFNQQLKDKDAAIKDKDTQIQESNARLVVSEGKYQSLVTRYGILQKEKINVKPAQTDKEMVARYNALGFTSVPSNWTGGGIICFPTGYSK